MTSINRDIRIDIFRGFAMLTVAINHMSLMLANLGLQGKKIPTLTAYGFSSAAEIFFLLSGYMVGLVYLGKPHLKRKLLSRAWMIYQYNVAAFLAVVVIAFFGPPLLAEVTSVSITHADPIIQSAKFAILAQHPDLLGVLGFYVLLMATAPLMIALAEKSLAAAIILCLTLYACAQFISDFTLPGGLPNGDGYWQFNPFAWQILFFGGILAGKGKALSILFDWLERNRWRCLMVLGAFGIATLLFKLTYNNVPPVLWSKENLGIVRVAHALLVIGALGAVLILVRAHLDSLPAKIIGLCGRQTLICYAVSVPATYAIAGLWYSFGRSYLTYLFAEVVIVVVVVLTAELFEGRKRRVAVAAMVTQ